MRTAALVILFLISSLGLAQDEPSVDIFAGYSYLNIDTNGLTISRQSANGWEASASVNVWKYLAAEGDFSGYYKNNVLGSTVNVRDYSFVGGPRFIYRYVFGHALFGVDRLSGSVSGISISASQDSFAVILGGGVQVPVASHWAVRGSADWALTRHNIFGGTRMDQNNFRAAAGIVFTFRGHAQRTKAAAAPEVCGTNSPTPHPVSLKDLGISGESNAVYGFRIGAIAPGSAAEKAGLIAGDFILSVNCVAVHTADELTAALSRATGTALIAVNKPTWLPNQTEVHRLEVSK